MITNIKYFETTRDQGYYDSPLVHIALHMSPEMPALSVLGADGKVRLIIKLSRIHQWTVHTHATLVAGGQMFGNLTFVTRGFRGKPLRQK